MTLLAEIQAKRELKAATDKDHKYRLANMIAVLRATEYIDDKRMYPITKADIAKVTKLVSPINIPTADAIIKEVESET